MKTYVKKPVKIQAFEWDGSIKCIKDNVSEIDLDKFYLDDWYDTQIDDLTWEENQDVIVIDTLEGDLKASKGDYIIRGIKGEYYSCKPDVFKATYDEVERQDTSH